MDIQKVTLTAKPIKFEAINSDFTRAKCYVMALGKNRNRSHFTKEAVDDAMPTLGLIPVVAHIIQDDEKTYVGGHDSEWTLEGQNLYVKDLTVPFGVVVPDTYDYVDVEESDGTTATYLTADIVIWSGRYPEIMETVYSDDVYWSQSMEIVPEKKSKLEEDKNYTDIQKFRYSCLTLLGRDDDPEYNTVPCFPSARVEPYEFNPSVSDNFTTEFNEMMDRLKAVFSCDLNSERGEKMEEIKNTQVEPKDGDPDITKTSTEPEGNDESSAQTDTFSDDLGNSDGDITTNSHDDKDAFAATYLSKIDAVCGACRELNKRTEDEDAGIVEYINNYFVDMDDKFVFFNRVIDTFNYKDGSDKSESQTFRAPYSIVEDDQSVVATIDTSEETEMVLMLLTKDEAAKVESDREELFRLQNFESEYIAREKQEKKDAILDEFSDLSDNPNFVELMKNFDELDAEDVEDKCFAIRGRNMKVSYSTKKTQSTTNNIKIMATKEDADDSQPEPYGGFFINHKINL